MSVTSGCGCSGRCGFSGSVKGEVVKMLETIVQRVSTTINAPVDQVSWIPSTQFTQIYAVQPPSGPVHRFDVLVFSLSACISSRSPPLPHCSLHQTPVLGPHWSNNSYTLLWLVMNYLVVPTCECGVYNAFPVLQNQYWHSSYLVSTHQTLHESCVSLCISLQVCAMADSVCRSQLCHSSHTPSTGHPEVSQLRYQHYLKLYYYGNPTCIIIICVQCFWRQYQAIVYMYDMYRYTMVWVMSCLSVAHLHRTLTDYGGWHVDITG